MSPLEPVYTRADVMRITEASRSQMSHWPRLGIITPPARESSGAGDPRLFSERNLVEFRVGVLLAQLRMPAPIIAQAIEALAEAVARPDRVYLFIGSQVVAASFASDSTFTPTPSLVHTLGKGPHLTVGMFPRGHLDKIVAAIQPEFYVLINLDEVQRNVRARLAGDEGAIGQYIRT